MKVVKFRHYLRFGLGCQVEVKYFPSDRCLSIKKRDQNLQYLRTSAQKHIVVAIKPNLIRSKK